MLEIKCDKCGQILIKGTSELQIKGILKSFFDSGIPLTCRNCGNTYSDPNQIILPTDQSKN